MSNLPRPSYPNAEALICYNESVVPLMSVVALLHTQDEATHRAAANRLIAEMVQIPPGTRGDISITWEVFRQFVVRDLRLLLAHAESGTFLSSEEASK